MRIVEYTPEHFSALARAVADAAAGRSLGHQPFVDYYYTTRETCRLSLALDDDGSVAGAVGVEHIPFTIDGRSMSIGFASNFVAFRPGVGGVLFLHWVRSSELACIFGGSEHTHRILQSQRWVYFPGVRILRANGRFEPTSRDVAWRRAAKRVARATMPGVDLGAQAAVLATRVGRDDVRVREERAVTDDMLPQGAAFAFRMTPDAAYLNWRYATGLSFVGYRVFRVLRDDRSCGYVIVNEGPERVMVAQMDADDAETLVVAMLQALALVAGLGRTRRPIVLACVHTGMLELLAAAGFQADREERSFALGPAKRAQPIATDTTRWLVNLDWTDNGLRAPFLEAR